MKGTTITIALCAISVFAARTAVYAADASASAMQLPLQFEINRGQHASAVRFSARGPGYGLYLTDHDAVLVLSSASGVKTSIVRMSFVGATPEPMLYGVDELPGRVSYFRGRDPQAWHANIPTFARVGYRHLYRGLDLVYYGNQQQLEYDLILAPEADPRAIAWRFDGIDRLALTDTGDLVLHVAGGELRQHKPVIYQQIGDTRRAIAGRYVIRQGHLVGIEVAAYDRSRPLVIDPMLSFSSYLGGTRADIGERIVVDANGNAYLTGSTTSPDFPATTGPLIASDLEDVFVAKVNAQGNALVYATYVGGTGSDKGRAIAIDGAGRAYVTGVTNSADFPVVNAAQSTPGGLNDAFVIELSAAGDALVYATYLGGSGADNGAGIAVDRRGSAYVTGTTASLNFPTVNAFQQQIAGIDPSTDAFVTKLNPEGSSLAYSTYLGGGEPDSGNAIAVNGNGNAYVTGVTGSGDFPTRQPFQATALRGVSEAFVTKLSRDGLSLVYSSNLGGNRSDAGLDITLDDDGRAVVVGVTSSTDFPQVRPLQPGLAGGASFDGFVTVVNAAGSALAFSTDLGGTSRDEITGVAVDAAGDIYVAGRTFSSDFPLVKPTQASFGGGSMDAFVAKIDVSRGRLVFATYLGGSGDDDGRGVAVDGNCGAYAIGTTTSNDFPTVSALQAQRAGDVDAFVAKISGIQCSPGQQR
jgi:hypothetical protein